MRLFVKDTNKVQIAEKAFSRFAKEHFNAEIRRKKDTNAANQ